MVSWAGPLNVSVAVTTSGRWLESAQVSTPRSRARLEGSEVTLGGTVDLSKRLGWLRFGGQLGVDVAPSPSSVDVQLAGPLSTSVESREGVSSLLFFDVAPFVGLVKGDDVLVGWVDVLVAAELTSARIGGERHFGLTPVPMVRLGCAFQASGFAFELSALGSYFGAPRLVFALGVRL